MARTPRRSQDSNRPVLDVVAVIVENTTDKEKELVGREDSIWIAPFRTLRVSPHFANGLPVGVKVVQKVTQESK